MLPVAAIYSDQMTIVISPLVALIDDQVAALKQLGVSVSKIHSGYLGRRMLRIGSILFLATQKSYT